MRREKERIFLPLQFTWPAQGTWLEAPEMRGLIRKLLARKEVAGKEVVSKITRK